MAFSSWIDRTRWARNTWAMLAIFILVMANVVDMVSFCFLVEGSLNPGEKGCTLATHQPFLCSIHFRWMNLTLNIPARKRGSLWAFSEHLRLTSFLVAPSLPQSSVPSSWLGVSISAVTHEGIKVQRGLLVLGHTVNKAKKLKHF